MKRRYQKPELNVVVIGQTTCLLQTSVTDTENNVNLHYRGRGNGDARVKGQGDDDWFDDWDD